jgi:hypothetical protein
MKRISFDSGGLLLHQGSLQAEGYGIRLLL